MSKVALRVYNRDIEALIDQGHIDEAVAHCQHILKTFPKHLETYRLLGKAYLEAHRHSDAADIFQRVLMAVPDDFVSHLGMSIVRDEQKDLDTAIWHMERAFEANPSNAGVQNELRRLYGRRDGLEPPKIRLTRGALAQMYTKGGQYQQAIVEIKAVLAEDPTRNDMKILLARAYFRAGMKVEATEICTELLKQYPHSLDANRILVEILPGTSLAGSLDLYKKRVHSLDPYTAFASTSIFDTDAVPDTAITVERLEYDAGAAVETSWQAPSAEPAAGFAVPAEQQEIPDWMKQAGWAPSSGESQEGQASFEESEQSAPAPSELAAAEIPDWLKAMAPPGSSAPETPVAQEEALAQQDLDWLAGLGTPPGGESKPASSAPEQPPAPQAVPEEQVDWLKDLGGFAAGAAATSATGEGLDWLDNLNTPQEEKPAEPQPSSEGGLPAQPAEEGFTPDWLKDLGTSQTPGESPGPAATQPETPAPAAGESLPGWLSDLTPAQAEAPAQSEPVADWLKDLSPADDSAQQPLSGLVSGPGTSESEQDEALKWLESLAEKQGAKAEELITNPAERTETIPDWVEKVEEVPPPPPAPPAQFIPEPPIEVEAEPVSGELSPVAKGPGTGPLEQDEGLKWLESLAEKQGAKAEELITQPEERIETKPGWVDEIENPPTELSALISGPGTTEGEQDDALKWLESLAMKQGAKAEELITNPEERTETAPDWVAKVGEEPAVPPAPQPLSEAPAKPKPPRAVAPDEEGFVPGPLSELVSGPGTTESEQDDALKWLESLAMKQGAKSEELITNPEERIEVAPDWVAKVGEEPAASAEPVPLAAEAPSAPQVEQGADMDWLAGLTAETIMPEGQPAEPASVAPESALPDWLSDATKPEEQPSSAPMPWEIPAEPGATQPMEPAEPVSFGPPAAETPAPADDWFASLEQPETQKPSTPMPWEQEAPTEAAEPVPWEQPAETPAPAEAQTSTDVSGWLDSLAQEEAPAAETPPTEAAVPRDEFPSWLESMPAAVPSVQPAPAESEELPDWLKDMSADEQPPVPEQVSEWMPAQETPAPPVSGVPVQEPPTQPQPASAAVAFEAPATAPVEESAPPPPLQLRSTAAAGDKDEHFINSARDYLTKGSLNEAMAEYSKLIKKNRLLEEVIYDLQEIVYSHPVDVIVWQTLGDAHMRSNRLQEALDAYTKAEELLR